MTYEDNREFASFRDTGWTEHIGVKTWNAMSFRPNVGIGRTRTVFGKIRVWDECGQHRVVDARNLGQGARVLLRTTVSKGCGLRTVKAIMCVKSPSDLCGGPHKSTRPLTSVVTDKGSGDRGRRKRRLPTGGWA